MLKRLPARPGVAHCHPFAAAEATPYLNVTSAVKQCGKTRLLEVLEPIVPSPWLTGRVSATVLVRAGTRFLVVGAHAMAAHGVPRATGDLDVWVDPAPENAERVWQALLEFGAPVAALPLSKRDLEIPVWSRWACHPSESISSPA